MKLKAIVLAVFVAGLGSSYALAGNGHGKGGDSTSTGTETSTTAHGHGHAGKVSLCHKAGKSGKWVKVTVSQNAAKSKLKHGDVAPDASGNCPAPTAPTTTEQSTTTTSNG